MKNNLRYKKDGCGDPISPSRKGLKTDQLYWTGTEEIGVYAERETKKKFTFLKQKLVEQYGFALTKTVTLMAHSCNERAGGQCCFLSLAALRMLCPKQQETR